MKPHLYNVRTKKTESIGNLVSGCPILRVTEYQKMYNKIVHYMNYTLNEFENIGRLDCEKLYKDQSKRRINKII